MGLLQVVKGTFAANMYPGHNNPFNPLDNILASMRYVARTYGHGNLQSGAQVLWNRGGGAYARGGFVGGSPIANFIRAARSRKPYRTPEEARIRGIRTSAEYEAPDILP